MKEFTKYHLAISKAAFEGLKGKAHYELDLRDGLSINRVEVNFESFMDLIDVVGGPWGWTRRPRYTALNVVQNRLADPATQLYLFKNGDEVIGYCLVTRPEGSDAALFVRPGAPANENGIVVEIENFGFVPSATGKGYGAYFLPLMFDILFRENDTVYLSTRSTNHARVVPFYKRLGMKIIDMEILPDDLVPLHIFEDQRRTGNV